MLCHLHFHFIQFCLPYLERKLISRTTIGATSAEKKGSEKELVNEACSAPNHHSNYLGNPIHCSCRSALASRLDSLLKLLDSLASILTLPNKFSTLLPPNWCRSSPSPILSPPSSLFLLILASFSSFGPATRLLSFLPSRSLTAGLATTAHLSLTINDRLGKNKLIAN